MKIKISLSFGNFKLVITQKRNAFRKNILVPSTLKQTQVQKKIHLRGQ